MKNVEMRALMSISSRERITDKYDLLKNTLHVSDGFREWMTPGTTLGLAASQVAANEPVSV